LTFKDVLVIEDNVDLPETVSIGEAENIFWGTGP